MEGRAILRITTVVGARPQFIKASALRALVDSDADVAERLIHTGQHYDDAMSGVFFRELGIRPPEASLEVGSGSHGAMTGRMLERIEADLADHPADVLLVYGDTNSTLAGALAAAKLGVPVAHVEAGLRSFNRAMPEEINRIVADHVADVLYAPTQTAYDQLLREAVSPEKVELVGDVMYDVALVQAARTHKVADALATYGLRANEFVFATVHRAETTDSETILRAVVEGLRGLARSVPVLWSVHPRTEQALKAHGVSTEPVRTTGPLSFHETLQLVRAARFVATDSGGLQKEAFFHRTPCVTMRTETEWGELVESGWNRLAPPDSAETLAGALLDALDAPPGRDVAPYGDGRAAEKILASLKERYAT
ncbi:MAG: UDP-N-acetylglucosamine 2-epimerase (non-hydrolyzing) [Fimbriimonadaceae bacterium]|nr:UDP-N-acetylglucosamine 2-epimerase (non-hydrolyzing) [Fimbriimonadaceae bacterium]QYK59255.1 MAG: UDP-N-acetylglucosamine 2-epimerase (non-hydrolyzing) [Fimbriimonadaceae bacterium]